MKLDMGKFVLVATFCSGLLVAASVNAGSMRCGNEVIEDGQLQPLLKSEVEEKCGKPTVAGDVEWIYDRGPGSRTVLLFNGQQLISIQSDDN